MQHAVGLIILHPFSVNTVMLDEVPSPDEFASEFLWEHHFKDFLKLDYRLHTHFN